MLSPSPTTVNNPVNKDISTPPPLLSEVNKVNAEISQAASTTNQAEQDIDFSMLNTNQDDSPSTQQAKATKTIEDVTEEKKSDNNNNIKDNTQNTAESEQLNILVAVDNNRQGLSSEAKDDAALIDNSIRNSARVQAAQRFTTKVGMEFIKGFIAKKFTDYVLYQFGMQVPGEIQNAYNLSAAYIAYNVLGPVAAYIGDHTTSLKKYPKQLLAGGALFGLGMATTQISEINKLMSPQIGTDENGQPEVPSYASQFGQDVAVSFTGFVMGNTIEFGVDAFSNKVAKILSARHQAKLDRQQIAAGNDQLVPVQNNNNNINNDYQPMGPDSAPAAVVVNIAPQQAVIPQGSAQNASRFGFLSKFSMPKFGRKPQANKDGVEMPLMGTANDTTAAPVVETRNSLGG